MNNHGLESYSIIVAYKPSFLSRSLYEFCMTQLQRCLDVSCLSGVKNPPPDEVVEKKIEAEKESHMTASTYVVLFLGCNPHPTKACKVGKF